MSKENAKKTKVISISYEAWQILNKLKRPGQSYSGVIIEWLGPIVKKQKQKEVEEHGKAS